MYWYKVDLSGSGQGHTADSCESSNENSGSIQEGNWTVTQMSKCQEIPHNMQLVKTSWHNGNAANLYYDHIMFCMLLFKVLYASV